MGEIDWVSVRAECSLAVIFERLKMQLEQDVEKRNAQIGRPAFSFVTKEKRAAVVLTESVNNDSISFVLTAGCIEVRNVENGVMFKATPTVNDDGECRLKINGNERELWQLRKQALEDFFFSL